MAISFLVIGNSTLLLLPLPDLYKIVLIVLVNGLLGLGTIVVWSRYNQAREKVRVSRERKRIADAQIEQQQKSITSYVQDVKLTHEAFNRIAQSDGRVRIELDATYLDVFKKGRKFHIRSDVDYGSALYIEVMDVYCEDDNRISIFFHLL